MRVNELADYEYKKGRERDLCPFFGLKKKALSLT